jgi:6-phosphogluconate dehydrogenase
MIGLGKMGYNITQNLLNHGHQVVAFDLDDERVACIRKEGAETVSSIAEAVASLPGRKVLWLMIPAGKAVDSVIDEMVPLLSPGDILIDGGNSNYKDTVERYGRLKTLGISLLDCGTSGGTSGALEGACTMVGGDREAFDHVEEIFRDLSVEDGYLYVGTSGSGHFVKMVHNGIEYGMMQAMAEGFEVLHKSPYDIDYEKVAKLWNHGSVIRGWLMELMESAFTKDSRLEEIRGVMNSSGEGRWTVETAFDLGVPTPVIAMSLFMRYRSLEDDTFAGKVVSALRNEFGGHAVVRK